MGRITQVTAGTWIHSRGEHDAGGVGQTHGRPAESDDPIFQRLAQNLKHVSPEFRQLVEEQDTAVGQADLARPG
jgi:hypothetical protein